MLKTGDAAPEVSLITLSGDPFLLSECLKAGSAVLVFFKISCPTCQFTLPFLERLHASGAAGKTTLIGISQDDASATREFNRQFNLSLPVAIDPRARNYPASNAYGITNVPSLFLIEADRRVAWSLNGFHKSELEGLGQRQFGRSPFEMGERIPAMRPG